MYIEQTTLDGEELMYAIQDVSVQDLYIMVSALEVLAFKADSIQCNDIQRIIHVLKIEKV